MLAAVVDQALQQPVADRAQVLIGLAEDQWFDRKGARVGARALADALIGFANAEGGAVVIGLSNGKVQDISGAGPQVNAWRQAAMDFAVPMLATKVRNVACRDDRGQPARLLLLEVDPSDRVHANQRDEVYLRVGDENRKLTFSQRQELSFDKGQSTYEVTTFDGTLGDLDDDGCRQYAGHLGHPDWLRLFRARGLVTRAGVPTVAALLMFGLQPQGWLPEAGIRILRYRGRERGTGARQQLLHDERIEGPIPLQLDLARQRILELIPTRRALNRAGRFEQIGLVPPDVWLEALVNAAIHRSYSISGDHIRVEIFDDRLEIESPGRFPGIAINQRPEDVIRFARNPRIARVASDLDIGQELGEGIRRMFEEMRLAGLADPSYQQTAGSVRVTLLATPVDRELESRLPSGARDLVRIIREDGPLSTGDLMASTGRSRPYVLRTLRALQEAGVVEWVGKSTKDPRASWQLRTN